MALYTGLYNEGQYLVLKDKVELDPRYSLGIANHSPTGFCWGYLGSGPAQLALALLLEETGREEAVLRYQDFKAQIVARWPQKQNWFLTSEKIRTWLKERP